MQHNYVYIEPKDKSHKPIKAWIKGVSMEEEARQQLEDISGLPFIHSHVAAMPDVHWGIGATVGSVIATKGAIVPAAVGVDIGCGMMAVKTNLTSKDLPEDLSTLRAAIEKAIPHGRTNDGKRGDRGAWGTVPDHIGRAWQKLEHRYKAIIDKHPKASSYSKAEHLGTLGGGNHFVELCLDENDTVWAMLHSGSRGLGNRFGTYFIEQAKEEMQKYFIHLANADQAYLVEGSQLFDDYWEAVQFAQEFAALNRSLMMENLFGVLRHFFPHVESRDVAVNCHHNYVDRENHFGANVLVTRKGAVRARETDLGIIPGSMGAKSFIVQGKGNKDSFCSCSHGAGRVMSRTEAQRQITLEDHLKATAGVECRKDREVLDESPAAYKSIDAVIEAQKDLIEVKHTLKQFLCVKG